MAAALRIGGGGGRVYQRGDPIVLVEMSVKLARRGYRCFVEDDRRRVEIWREGTRIVWHEEGGTAIPGVHAYLSSVNGESQQQGAT